MRRVFFFFWGKEDRARLRRHHRHHVRLLPAACWDRAQSAAIRYSTGTNVHPADALQRGLEASRGAGVEQCNAIGPPRKVTVTPSSSRGSVHRETLAPPSLGANLVIKRSLGLDIRCNLGRPSSCRGAWSAGPLTTESLPGIPKPAAPAHSRTRWCPSKAIARWPQRPRPHSPPGSG